METKTAPTACPKCGGNLFQKEEEYGEKYWACLQCSRHFTDGELEETVEGIAGMEGIEGISEEIPPKPKGRVAVGRYHDENKERILADLAELGQLGMCRKWSISSSTWPGLRKKWGIASSRSRGAKVEVPSTEDTALHPPLPEFSNDWPEAVQLKWFDTYAKLRGFN